MENLSKNQLIKLIESMPGMVGTVRWISYRAGTKELLRESPVSKNKIMFGSYTGYDQILKRLAGDNTYTMNILYMDIGTSATAPALSDTQLTAAVARAAAPVITQVSNVVSFQFFFADASLANGTYREVGTFIDGTASINTGQIFNHALFATPYVKTSNEDTTVQIDFTQNSSS